MPFTSSGSPMISAIVMRGLSEENGSWKIICICRRSGRSCLARQARHVDLGAALGAEADLAGGRRDGAQDAARGGGLAAAALADQRQRLAAIDGEAHVVHRAHLADGATEQSAMDGIELAQIADVEDAGHEPAGEAASPSLAGGGWGRGPWAPPPPPTPSRKGRGSVFALRARSCRRFHTGRVEMARHIVTFADRDFGGERPVAHAGDVRRGSADGTGSRRGAHRDAGSSPRSSPAAPSVRPARWGSSAATRVYTDAAARGRCRPPGPSPPRGRDTSPPRRRPSRRSRPCRG